MMTLDKDGNYQPWVQPAYGRNAQDKRISPPKGYTLRRYGERVGKRDIVFDVYSGWMTAGDWDAKNGHTASSFGRWTTWARRTR